VQHSDPAFQKEVKRALTHWHDLDYLGDCPLARRLLPDGSLSAEERGRLLQQFLREAIERLRPSKALGNESLDRAYYFLTYRYINRQSRQAVMSQLAISLPTLHREQRKAIAAVCEFLWEKEQALRVPPIRPWPIPRLQQFVGREAELTYYRGWLEAEYFAAIVGPPGAGKTSLGAELAAGWEARGQPVIWVTLRDGRNTDLESLLETIGLSLAALGQEAAWRFLQAERRKEFPLSLESRVRYLLTLLEEKGCLLCLDDLHLARENKAINSLCADLLQSAQRGRLWLLVMSRLTPRFVPEQHFAPLMGLSQEDARRLLATLGLPALPEALLANLYARTAGSPIFLKLFVTWAYGQGLDKMTGQEAGEKAAAFVANMVREQDVRSYLLHEMYETLSSQEQRFLACAAAFRLPFDTEDKPIIALLTAEGVQDIDGTLIGLADKHVFTYIEHKKNVSLHPLLREYAQHRLRMNPADQARLHRRVGEYYEQGGDVLEAGYHYFEASDYERAARLLSENVMRLINAGQAGAALEQLDQLTPTLAYVTAELRFEAAAAREALCHLLGRREKQASILSVMLALAEELGGRQLALSHNRRSRFHEAQGEYAAAVAAAGAAQTAARQAGDKQAEAEASLKEGSSLWRRGEYAAARERIEQALALAQEVDDRRGQAKCLNNLGVVCRLLCDYATAKTFHEQALALHRSLGDREGETVSLNNLGLVCNDLGEHLAARTYHEQSLAIAQAIGDQQAAAANLSNLGLVCLKLGDYASARTYCEQSLVIARAINERLIEASSLHNLGRVYYELGDGAAARAHYEQSLVIHRDIGDRAGVAYALIGLGVALEDLGNPSALPSVAGQALDGAEAAYGEALSICREIGQAAAAIEGVAGLGRAALAHSELQKAKQYAEECLAHIAAHGAEGIEYRFEVYLTCMDILAACDEHERAQAVLEEAHGLLMQRADKINDEALRHSYLENVSAHREVMQRWAAAG
jgi:ATP/maltotriose-dependent transcriptional regulator MalT